MTNPNIQSKFDEIWGSSSSKTGEYSRSKEIMDIANEAKAQKQTKPEEKKGYLQRVGETYAGNVKSSLESSKKVMEAMNQGNPDEALKQTGLGVAENVGHLLTAPFVPIVEAVSPTISSIVGAGLKATGQEENASKTMESISKWSSEHPDASKALGALFDIVGGGVGGKVAPKVGKDILEKSPQFLGKAGETVSKGAGALKQGIAPTPTPSEALKQIAQGTTKDVKPFAKALTSIETKGVKTYEELSNKFKEAIPNLSKQVDAELGKDQTKTTLKNLATELTAKSGKNVYINYVEKSIKDLAELYGKTGEIAKQQDMKDLLKKASKEGLTKLEINNIARNYGEEFSSKAFSKVTGEPLTSVNAQAFENTRSGLKDLARKGMGPEAQALDKTMSATYDAQKLTQKSVEAVNKLSQKIQQRGWGENIGRALGSTVNLVGMGGPKGLVEYFLGRGTGLKTLNALDLEKNIANNLKIIEKASKAKTADDIIKILTESKGK